MAVQFQRYRFTVDEYSRMAEIGILREDSRVELINGEIIHMHPIGKRHAGGVDRLTYLFVHRVGDRANVRGQNPVRLGEHNEPEPDLMLLRWRADFYAAGHPTPEQVLLVVEIADSSVEYDRQVKSPLYGGAGIPEYWLVNLERDHIVAYRDPTEDGYATTRILRYGESISPLAFPDLTFTVDETLG